MGSDYNIVLKDRRRAIISKGILVIFCGKYKEGEVDSMSGRTIDIVIFTYDYPFGSGDPYLETEITWAADKFRRVYVVSSSRNAIQTRSMPNNAIAIKVSRGYHRTACVIHIIKRMLSYRAIVELNCLLKLEHKPNIVQVLRAWSTAWGLEKRYMILMKTLRLSPETTIAYSYWLASSAYFIANNPLLWRFSISRAHSFEIRDHESYNPFLQVINKHLKLICFISLYTQNEYNRILRSLSFYESGAKQTIARLGVNMSEIIPVQSDISAFRIVTCSALKRIKRLDLLVQALELIETSVPVVWTHFGWGPEGEKIRALCINTLAGRESIKWEFVGEIENTKILSYYESNYVDLFINVSDYEGIPVSIMEAMAFGIPCFARDVGGNSEIVIDGSTGYLIRKEASVREIANKLILEHAII